MATSGKWQLQWQKLAIFIEPARLYRKARADIKEYYQRCQGQSHSPQPLIIQAQSQYPNKTEPGHCLTPVFKTRGLRDVSNVLLTLRIKIWLKRQWIILRIILILQGKTSSSSLLRAYQNFVILSSKYLHSRSPLLSN
jgi:hypothetical protein